MSFRFPFCLNAALAASAVAAIMLLTPASVPCAHAEGGQQAALKDATKQDAAKPVEAPATGAASSVDQSNPVQKSAAARAIDKVKEVARSASDIFSRVPCLPPKGGYPKLGSLPHVAQRLIAGEPVMIVAFGSSSTQGHGVTSPEFTYPNRLAAQLRRQYPGASIIVLNRGKGGEDAPEMMRRLQSQVIDMKPDLVIWQVGTNAVLRNVDPVEIARSVEEGVAQIQAAGSDVVLVDLQYSPAVTARAETAGKMVKLLGKVAELRKVGIFPRFEVMREWHEKQSIPTDEFITSDGLHMSDWGYSCFAQLLGDDIIKSVGQINRGVALPSDVRTYRPM
jgi:lysophospholipase L1-like esterase